MPVYNARRNKADIVRYFNSILPLLRQNVADFRTQKHCIEIVDSAITLLNSEQTIVDTSDQPVYVISKRLQQLYPHKFGRGKYFRMSGGFHIEKILIEGHDQLRAGSGLPRFLHYVKLSITGAGNIALNVPNITAARYFIQVYLCAEFRAMILILENEETILDFEKWMNEKSYESPIFYYWKMIVDLQVLMLYFVRSERERNFNLYAVLNSSIKYIFALDHYNYVRWLNLHVDDLLKLEYMCPDVYKEFINEHFPIRKIENPFSSIAIDQTHEQNNAVTKEVGGAVRLVSQNMDTALRRSEISGSRVVRLLNEYEKCHHIGPEVDIGKHHEDYPAISKNAFYRCE